MKQIVLFAKMPRLGRVKSRLARGLGWRAATDFHRRTTAQLVAALRRQRQWQLTLWVAPDRAVAEAALWARLGASRVPRRAQGQGDLGRRMARPFRLLPRGPLLLIGTDIPELGPAQIAAAFRLLASHDAVFGPAEDGGFWLVGLKRRGDPFRNVRWSSAHALADTLANLGPARVAFLRPLSDIDTAEDYRLWRDRHAAAAAAR